MSRRAYLALFAVLLLSVFACGKDGIDIPGIGASEGAPMNPVPLYVGMPHIGHVDVYAPNDSSYYYFHADASGFYTIGLTGMLTDLGWNLYGGFGFFSFPLYSCDHYANANAEICTTYITAPGYYYLLVYNWDLAPTFYFLTVSAL